MTEKELKKLNRKQLLELLLVQTEKADSLALELEEARKKLEDKIIIQKEAGSIAEASMKLNEVFLSAQCAANQYLENISLIVPKNLLDKFNFVEDLSDNAVMFRFEY